MQCPECDKGLPGYAKKCSCGWGKGQQSNGASSFPPGNTVPCDIGGSITWVKACNWKTGGRQCCVAGTVAGYCLWHAQCSNNPKYAEDYPEFLNWLEVVDSPRWKDDPKILFAMVTGRGRWLEPGEMKPAERNQVAVPEHTAVPF